MSGRRDMEPVGRAEEGTDQMRSLGTSRAWGEMELTRSQIQGEY